MISSPDRVFAIVGPTAVGKSLLAVEVAEAIGGEIVSIDSTAIYRGMDIGTDKPPQHLRERVPHHLVDVHDPEESISVAQFQSLARRAIEDISARGKIPVLVGGSGLYFRAVVDPLTFPGTDPRIRERMNEMGRQRGAASMHSQLGSIDPEAAAHIDPNNLRRTVRALEVIELTGRRFSSFRTGWDSYESIYELHAVGLNLPLAELDDRIDARADAQIHRGLVEEVQALVERGMRDSITSVQALGYAQLLEHLDGRMSRQEAIDEIKRRTRKFARRQLTWFKADPRIVWFMSDPVAAKIHLIEKGNQG